jgi:hypothetical protein
VTAIGALGFSVRSALVKTAANTWTLVPQTTFGDSVVAAADAAALRTLGELGTAALKNTGTSGNNVPLLDGVNAWSEVQTANKGLIIAGISGSGVVPGAIVGDANFGMAFRPITPVAGQADYLWMDYGANTAMRLGGAASSLGAGLVVGAATGGFKGVGTVNAVAVYDDNSLLTCMPLNDGERDQAFWDSMLPDRVIETPAVRDEETGRELTPARVEVVETRSRTAKRFFDMKAEGFDANDPDIYFARLREDRALPGLPTIEEHERRYPVIDGVRQAVDKYGVGERTERMQLAMDFMAQTMATMYARIQNLEGSLAALEASR